MGAFHGVAGYRSARRLTGPVTVGQPGPMQCFACETPIELATGDRIGFRDTCDRCRADLHVCRNCRHHDPSAYNECRESNAERVGDRERANRCDYFEPLDGPRPATGGSREQALNDLESLFKK
jgi:hypothetical protein